MMSEVGVAGRRGCLLFFGLTMAARPVWCQHPLAPAQTQQTPATTQTPIAVSVAPYDVASIRMYPSMYFGGMHVGVANGSLSAEDATLKLLLRVAYDLPEKLLVGGPTWINEKTFDIKAKTDGVAPIDQAQLSDAQREAYNTRKLIPFQKLLTDRFQLKTHREDRVMPFYAIVAAKGGIKMKPSDENSDVKQLGQSGPTNSGVQGAPGIRVRGRGKIVAVRTTVEQLARYMTFARSDDIDRPVLNKTGLSGEYDFTLEWTPGIAPDDADSPSLFTAIQEQLGLKLEPQKGPVEVMVIDHAELPSEN